MRICRPPAATATYHAWTQCHWKSNVRFLPLANMNAAQFISSMQCLFTIACSVISSRWRPLQGRPADRRFANATTHRRPFLPINLLFSGSSCPSILYPQRDNVRVWMNSHYYYQIGRWQWRRRKIQKQYTALHTISWPSLWRTDSNPTSATMRTNSLQ